MDINEINKLFNNIIEFKINDHDVDLNKIEIKKYNGNQTWHKIKSIEKFHVFYNGLKIKQSDRAVCKI